MPRSVAMLLHNINLVNGGLTYAVLQRAEAFASLGHKVYILTWGFQNDYLKNVNYWKNRLNNSRNIEFINLIAGDGAGKAFPLPLGENETRVIDKKNPLGSRVFNNGEYVRYEKAFDNGSLDFVDWFKSPWTRTHKDVFGRNGIKYVRHFMHPTENKITYSVYYNRFGKSVYSTSIKLDGTPIAYYFHEDTESFEFSSLDEMVSYWVNSFLLQNNVEYLFVDKREHAKIYSEYNGYKKIFCMHSTHLKYPSDNASILCPTMYDLKESKDKYDYFWVLTDSQVNDFSNLMGIDKSKIIQLEHFITPVSPDEQQGFNFFNKKISMVARYHDAKNLSDAIRAFSYVVKKHPDAQLDLWGYGPEKNKLEDLIKKLSLENKVNLKGFTDKVSSIYKSSYLTLLTSKYEGQAMVIAESMSYGVPVLSYDVNYGPKSIIQDGVNGYLIEKYNIHQLAEKIIFLFENPEIRHTLSKNCRRINEDLSKDNYLKKLATYFMD